MGCVQGGCQGSSRRRRPAPRRRSILTAVIPNASICSVEEYIGGTLELGPVDCSVNITTTKNPPIMFYSLARVDPNVTVVVPGTRSQVEETAPLVSMASINSPGEDVWILNKRLHCSVRRGRGGDGGGGHTRDSPPRAL